MTLGVQALILNEENTETRLTALPEFSPELQGLVPEGPLSVVATGSRKDTVPGTIPVVVT